MPTPIHMSKRNSLGYAKKGPAGEPLMTDLYKRSGAKKIATRTGLDVWVSTDNDMLDVLVVDPDKERKNQHKIAMRLELSLHGKAWHVDIVRTDSRYKGRNLAVRVYVLLMKKLGLQMKAGSSQSIGGRKLWNRLNKHRDILVYARPTERSTKISLVKSGKQQLSSDTISLYGDDDVGSDAEILAYAIGWFSKKYWHQPPYMRQ